MEFASSARDTSFGLMTPANPGSHHAMPSTKEAKQALYYRRQASACAAAATTAASPEAKLAYLELEQGWLCLAPKAESPSEQRFPLTQRQTEPAAPDGAAPVQFHSIDMQSFTDSQNGFARVRAK
jgi:hypothetical protein